MSERLLSLAVAAQRVGVSTRTLRRVLNDPHGGLHQVRIGRRRLIHEADLSVWLHQHRCEPGPTLPPVETLFGLTPLFGNNIWLHALLAIVGGYFGWMHPDAQPAPQY